MDILSIVLHVIDYEKGPLKQADQVARLHCLTYRAPCREIQGLLCRMSHDGIWFPIYKWVMLFSCSISTFSVIIGLSDPYCSNCWHVIELSFKFLYIVKCTFVSPIFLTKLNLHPHRYNSIFPPLICHAVLKSRKKEKGVYLFHRSNLENVTDLTNIVAIYEALASYDFLLKWHCD